jgi:uncharacterized protein YciI
VFTFVFLNKKVGKAEIPKEHGDKLHVDKLMEGHMANMKRLAEENKLMAAGPFDGGGGIFVFASNSVDEVTEWIQTDPAVKANRWNVEILPYVPLIGSICKVAEPYQMVSYSFIRFWYEKEDISAEEFAQISTDHELYWRNQNESKPMVTFASFGNKIGDILISVQLIDEKILLSDPSIAKGLVRFEKKTLWIAKGSFCEK